MITYDQIAALNPCWLREGRAEELRRRVGDGVTAMQIAAAADVSINDRRWLLTNLLARGPRPDLRALVRWACACALDAVDTIRDWHAEGVMRACIETTLRWCDGDATIEEVRRDCADAAAAAAYAAAAAAAYAAYAAAAADAAADAADAADAAYAAARTSVEAHLRQLARIIDGGSL